VFSGMLRISNAVINAYLWLVCHAELNAILNKNTADVKDCTIYVALFPCNECAKVIIQSGISEVVYACDKNSDKQEYVASRRLLEMAGVKLTSVQSSPLFTHYSTVHMPYKIDDRPFLGNEVGREAVFNFFTNEWHEE